MHDTTQRSRGVRPLTGATCVPEHPLRPGRSLHGFTLIELLVVIAIIGVLIALLLPSLRQARYTATMVKRASNQRQVAISATASTVDNRGWWPARSMPFDERGLSAPFVLKFTTSEAGKGYDDRPNLTPHIPINLAGQCPFNEQLDYENSTADQIQINYSFYFGFQFSDDETPMDRTDRLMTFRGHEFDILVADRTRVYADRPWTDAAHPDFGTSRMMPIVQNDAGWTSARYRLNGSIDRGPVDLNFTRVDGSSFRINDVEPEDPRLEKVPYKHAAASSISTRWSLLPARD